MAMDAAELGRWMRFAAKGGIGKCVAIRDCEAQEIGDLMFLEGDEIIVLHQVPPPAETAGGEPSGSSTQFLGYCEEIVGRFNARDVRFTTRLKKAVMTKRASASSTSTSALAGAASSSSPVPLSASSPVPIVTSSPIPVSASTSTSSTMSSASVSAVSASTRRSPAMSPPPSNLSNVHRSSSAGLTTSPRASPAPSTFSTASSSTLGIHEPNQVVRSASAVSGYSSSAPRSGLGVPMSSGANSSGGGVVDSLERRSSAAASTSAARTASPLQRSYTSPAPSIPTSPAQHSTFNSSMPSNPQSSTLVSSPTPASFVSFSPTPSSVSPSPRDGMFPTSISASGAATTPPVSQYPSTVAPATRSVSYSTPSSARSSPSPSPALHHSRSFGSTSSTSTPSSPTPASVPLAGATSTSASSSTSSSPRLLAQPLQQQPHSQQQHRYTAHAPSPLSFATASALSQRVSSTSSSSARGSYASYASYTNSYTRSSSAGGGGGTPTSPAFSAAGTLSPTSPAFSVASFSGSNSGGMGYDGLTPTTTTNPLRITKRSPSVGHGGANMNIPGLRSPPPASPLPELPVGAGAGGSANGSRRGSETGSAPSVSGSTSDRPSSVADSSSSSAQIASSILPPLELPSIAEGIPPSLSVPSTITTPTVMTPTSLTTPTTATTIGTAASESPMPSAYAARMAFTPLSTSVGGGFGAIAGHVRDEGEISESEKAEAVGVEVKGGDGEERRVEEHDIDETGERSGVKAVSDMQDDEQRSTEAQLPSTSAVAMSTSTANDIGLSLLQLQDLADGMYSYGSDSDSDSQYSSNSYAASRAASRSGVGSATSAINSLPSSRAASRSDGKVVDGVGVVDRNGRRKSVVPASGARRATMMADTGGGVDISGSPSPSRIGERVEEEDADGGEDAGSEDETVEGVAYDMNERVENEAGEERNAEAGGDGTAEVDDEEAKALLAKMEAMNAMVAAMPAFPTKPSPGVVARSAVAGATSPSASAGARGSSSSAGTHLSPTSPTFTQPDPAAERERRPSLASAYSSHSVRSARSGASGTSGATSGSGEDYDIYDSYRYSRYSVLSGRSGTSQATISSLPRAGGRRMDSMGSVDEGQEEQGSAEQGPRARGLDMILDELSFGDEGVQAVAAAPSHERTISVDSEASVYTQDSSEQAKEADTTVLGVSTGSTSTSTSTSTAAGVRSSIASSAANRPAPLDLSKHTTSSGGSKSVTSPLLHTSWGSAASSAKSTAAPFDVNNINNASFGVQAQNLVAALGVEPAGEVKSARVEVEGRIVSPRPADAMRQPSESEDGIEEGDRTVSTIVDGTGLGHGIVVEDDEELPSRIEDDGLDMDDTMTSMNTRRSSASPEPLSNGPHVVVPETDILNRTPSPLDARADNVSVAVPRPPRSAGLSPFAASNQRRSIFLPHPGAPKAPTQADNEAAANSTMGQPSSLSPHDAQHLTSVHHHPQTQMIPTPRPDFVQMIQISLTTPPRPPPPILPGMRLPPAPLMKGPTIYGRTDVDLCSSVGPVSISWSIDPFPVPSRSNSGSANVIGKSKGGSSVTGQAQSQPMVNSGRGYPSRSMSMGTTLATHAAPATSSPLAKSASVSSSLAISQPPSFNVTATPSPLAPRQQSHAVTGGGGALPRANFVPRVPALRPRSRSFSGFNSSNELGEKKVVHEGSSPSIPTSNSSLVVPSTSHSSTSSTSTSLSGLSSSPSRTSVSSATSSSSSVSAPMSKPPVPSASKPIPKPPSTLNSKKPSSLSLRSSPLSTSLSLGGGLKSPKMPSSPLAMSVMVAQRDSVVSVSDVREVDLESEKQSRPDPSQLRLRAMGSMPNLGSSSTSSFSSTLSPRPKSPSPLSIASTTQTSNKSTNAKDNSVDTEVKSMSSPVSTRGPTSPPPFSGLPLLVPPPSQQPNSQEPLSPLHSGAVSPSQQQPHASMRPQRQPSLRNKLSLPNLRRKHSRPEDDEPDRERERDIRGPTQHQHDRHTQREMDQHRKDHRERDDTLDMERERELLQVRDLEFELVRPSLPAAQREWGAARTSEDSGVLGRDTGSFDYSSTNGGPFRGADGGSRASFESRGSLDMPANGTVRGDRTEGSKLRPSSPSFSVASGTPSSKSLPTQSGNSDSPTSPEAAFHASSNANTPAEIEAHRAREQRWLSLLASGPSPAGAAAYTLPPSSTSSSNMSSSAPSLGPSIAYAPNPLAKSRKTRKLLLESAVPSSVRFRVWVFLTDARARAVPGVYDALVGRGTGRVNSGVVGDIRRDIRAEYEKRAARATSPSLASRASISRIDDGGEDETLAALKPFTPSQTGGDSPVTTLLLAYLNMVPDISYSRGLVNVLSHLLLLSPDEDAFWIFVSVMDSWLRGYFVVLPGNGTVYSGSPGTTTPVAPQMDVDALLFMRALESNEPQVAKRLLVDVGLSGVSICWPWFSSVFVGTLPVDHLNRVWDLFLFEGIPFLIRVGIALIGCLKRHLLAPLPLASSISASSALGSQSVSSQSPHATTLLSLLHTPPSTVFPPSPDAFITMALGVKLKDDDLRKQRVKMEQQVSLKMRQQISSSSALAAPGHRPGSIRGSLQALRAGGSVISLPRAAS